MSRFVLEDLPKDLVIYILRMLGTAAATSLEHQLCMLPPEFHACALHAAFPSILAGRELSLECVSTWLRPYLTTLFSLAATAGLLKLDLCYSYLR